MLELFLGNPSTGEVRMPDTRILTRTSSKAEEEVVQHKILVAYSTTELLCRAGSTGKYLTDLRNQRLKLYSATG